MCVQTRKIAHVNGHVVGDISRNDFRDKSGADHPFEIRILRVLLADTMESLEEESKKKNEVQSSGDGGLDGED